MTSSRVRLAAVALAAVALTANLFAADSSPHDALHARKAADRLLAQPLAQDAPSRGVACVNGFAGQFPCHNVDLEAWLPFSEIGGGEGNDIWGWTDPETGHEYALMGKTTGTAIIDVTEPTAPLYLGDIGTQTRASSWRDIKVHDNVAYIVSEAVAHGIQAFDLTLLRGATVAQEWPITNWQIPAGAVHNLAINEDSGRGYAVGSTLCRGGPYVIDLASFTPVTSDGCVDGDGYTHDMECVIYDGPDADWTGREICLALNEDTVTIWDLTDPLAPIQVSRTTYPGADYTHQGWLTDDRGWFLVGDEGDETSFKFNTTTLVFDVHDLDAPVLVDAYEHDTRAIDHNLYITGNVVHQANYRAGYRLLELTDLANAELTEVAFFDVYPFDDEARFNGAWSVYPFFSSGTVVVSGIEQGLFVLRPTVEYQLPVQRTSGPTGPLGALGVGR